MSNRSHSTNHHHGAIQKGELYSRCFAMNFMKFSEKRCIEDHI